MSEIVKSEPIENGSFIDYWSDGRIQARDSGGKFIQHPANYTPPERAREIKAGRTKRFSPPVQREVEALLDALPSEVLEDEREAFIIRNLATSLVTGGAGTAAVARELINRVGLSSRQKPPELRDGERCPTCGAVRTTIQLSEGVAARIMELIAQRQQEG